MAETTYTHSIADDTLNGQWDQAKYGQEIRNSRQLMKGFVSAVEDDGDIKTTFANALDAGEETFLDNLVAAHDGIATQQEHLNAVGIPMVAPCFVETGGYNGVYLGFRWEVTEGTDDIYDYDLQSNMKLQGGYRRVYSGGTDPVDEDELEMEVVDKDNFTGMFDGTNPNGMNPNLVDLELTVGTDVLSVFKYVRDEPVDEDDIGKRHNYEFASATFVPAGLYLRCKYESQGTGEGTIIMKCGYKGYEA